MKCEKNGVLTTFLSNLWTVFTLVSRKSSNEQQQSGNGPFGHSNAHVSGDPSEIKSADAVCRSAKQRENSSILDLIQNTTKQRPFKFGLENHTPGVIQCVYFAKRYKRMRC